MSKFKNIKTNAPLPPDELRGDTHPPLAVLHTDHADAEELVRSQFLVNVPVLQPQLVMNCCKWFILRVSYISQDLDCE